MKGSENTDKRKSFGSIKENSTTNKRKKGSIQRQKIET